MHTVDARLFNIFFLSFFKIYVFCVNCNIFNWFNAINTTHTYQDFDIYIHITDYYNNRFYKPYNDLVKVTSRIYMIAYLKVGRLIRIGQRMLMRQIQAKLCSGILELHYLETKPDSYYEINNMKWLMQDNDIHYEIPLFHSTLRLNPYNRKKSYMMTTSTLLKLNTVFVRVQ